jgi:hypothetical protein
MIDVLRRDYDTDMGLQRKSCVRMQLEGHHLQANRKGLRKPANTLILDFQPPDL